VLNQHSIKRLKNNWGEKADSLHCLAEIRLYDPQSTWECYLYALNPEDEDEVRCIVKVSHQQEPSLEKWYLTNIKSLFNSHGEGVQVDQEYRPINTRILFKKLKGEYVRD